jgi:lipoprotein-releasing system permease protein
MKQGLILRIAKTHLLSRFKQSLIAGLGVTFGISMFIAMVSFMTGVNVLLEKLMLSSTPHIHIYNDIKTNRKTILDILNNPEKNFNVVHNVKPKDEEHNIKDGLPITELIKKDPHVYGASPLVTSQVFYNNGSTPINGSISGVDILEQDKLFNLGEKIVKGDLKGLLSVNDGIIIGSGLAEKLNVGVNDRVNITTPTGAQIQLNIVGIFTSGISMIDNIMSYSTLKTAQKIMGKSNDYITDINIKLKNIDDAPLMAKTFGRQFDYKSDDWLTSNAEILVSFTLRNVITYAVSVALLIVAGFGIYNILTMMIYENMNDIAILKATGFTGNDIMKLFLTEALLIGMTGGIAGLFLGFLISLGISNIPFHSKAVISMNHMPVNFDPQYYLFGLLFALITTAISGFLPARKASKVDPVSIIRGK